MSQVQGISGAVDIDAHLRLHRDHQLGYDGIPADPDHGLAGIDIGRVECAAVGDLYGSVPAADDTLQEIQV